MILDGYRETDKAAAFERGVDRVYRFPAPYGPDGGKAELHVTIKYAGSGNAEYLAALAEAETEDQRLQALYDHCVIRWATTLQSGGKDVDPTRENFLALLKIEADEISLPLSRLVRDIYDRQNFVLERQRASEKN